jgi:3-oxoacyl-[acyl-carrier-protein] synthase-3
MSDVLPVAYHLPADVVTNQEIAQRFNIKPERIFRATGVNERRKLSEGVISSDLGIQAAELLFIQGKAHREAIDFVIFCSHGFDYKGGVTAALIHKALGLKESCGVMDMPQGCTGYIYGLLLAKALVVSGEATNVLFIAADMPTTVIHPDDMYLVSLFGDAAAVTLIGKTEAERIGKFHLGTDGDGYFNLFVDGSHARNPTDMSWLQFYGGVGGLPRGRMRMDGQEIFSFGLQRVPVMIDEILKRNDLQFDEIDLFVLHQANGFLLQRIMRKLGLGEDRFVIDLKDTGNTVCATIPIALERCREQGRLKPGMKVLVAGFGIGYCWGGTVIQF